MLETLIHQLTQELGIEELKAIETGHYRLFLADHFEVDIFNLSQSYLFKSSIGSVPEDKEPLFVKLMEANLFAMGTRGAAIGLQPDEQVLTLSLELSYNSSYKMFKEKLEDFISILDFWRSEILKL